MGLTLGQMQCINCKSYRFSDEDFEGSEVRIDGCRGDFQIPSKCGNCGAEMVLVIDKEIKYNSLPTYNTHSTAIAYSHTVNDEPCYDESCTKCTGNGKGWWEDSDEQE